MDGGVLACSGEEGMLTESVMAIRGGGNLLGSWEQVGDRVRDESAESGGEQRGEVGKRR